MKRKKIYAVGYVMTGNVFYYTVKWMFVDLEEAEQFRDCAQVQYKEHKMVIKDLSKYKGQLLEWDY